MGWCTEWLYILWVRVLDVEALAQRFVRVPLELFAGQFSEHLHLCGLRLVARVLQTNKDCRKYPKFLSFRSRG